MHLRFKSRTAHLVSNKTLLTITANNQEEGERASAHKFDFSAFLCDKVMGSNAPSCTVAKKPQRSLDTPSVVHRAAVLSSICWALAAVEVQSEQPCQSHP